MLKDVRIEQTAERPRFRSGQELWDWMLFSNPISGIVVTDVSEDQRAQPRQVLDGMLRQRAREEGQATLTNRVNIGIGAK